MKITEQHVSDERIKQLIEWVDERYLLGTAPARRIAYDLDLVLLELTQRRAEDRHREANGNG